MKRWAARQVSTLVWLVCIHIPGLFELPNRCSMKERGREQGAARGAVKAANTRAVKEPKNLICKRCRAMLLEDSIAYEAALVDVAALDGQGRAAVAAAMAVYEAACHDARTAQKVEECAAAAEAALASAKAAREAVAVELESATQRRLIAQQALLARVQTAAEAVASVKREAAAAGVKRDKLLVDAVKDADTAIEQAPLTMQPAADLGNAEVTAAVERACAAAQDAAAQFAAAVERRRERDRLVVQQRLEKGRQKLQEAKLRVTAALDDASTAGVQGRDAVTGSINIYQHMVAEARAAEERRQAGDVGSFNEAANSALGAAMEVLKAVTAKRGRVAKQTQALQDKLAHLETPANTLAEVEKRMAHERVMEDVQLLNAIHNARAALEAARRSINSALPRSDGSEVVMPPGAILETMRTAARTTGMAQHELAMAVPHSAAHEPKTAEAQHALVGAPVAAALGAIAEARRCLRDCSNAQTLRALTLDASLKVDVVEHVLQDTQLSAAVILRRRAAVDTRLRAFAELLDAARASLSRGDLLDDEETQVSDI
ncbi:hypothetical protein JKP88DRAFT_254888 [Tribonema minus]|uniref:Uncharacterized protein n=1 Tax=Tribonema minus TaxID=303371 RepID=A0A835Z8R8_9STRA|nr:hypothetical protein JKP88DRAFT_254888 [Tribonema minus]